MENLDNSQFFRDLLHVNPGFINIQPVRRGNSPWIVRCLLFLSIPVGIWFTQPRKSVVWQFLGLLSAIGIGEFLHRASFLVEELQSIHILTRYGGDTKKVFQRLIGSKIEAFGFVASIIFPNLLFFTNILPSASQDLSGTYFLLCVACKLLSSLFKFEKNPFVVFRTIESQHSGLFYGISMAYSFFHGYLDIVLPDHGHTDDRHFREKIQEYIDANSTPERRIEVTDKRLYILIPSSGKAPTDICHNASDENQSPWMDKCLNLDSVKRDRGGIRQRTYHNTMYKVKNPADPDSTVQYVVAEYATPLITYHEACNYSSSDESWRTFRYDTVISFYETLQDILKASDCNNMVKLVYFNDKNEQGGSTNVGRVLLESLNTTAAQRGRKND